jgi:hypothetical protein
MNVIETNENQELIPKYVVWPRFFFLKKKKFFFLIINQLLIHCESPQHMIKIATQINN